MARLRFISRLAGLAATARRFVRTPTPRKRRAANRKLGKLAILYGKPEGLHLAIQMAAFEAQRFRGPAHIPVSLVELLQDVVALVCLACLVQCRELLSATGDRAIDQHRKMALLDPR